MSMFGAITSLLNGVSSLTARQVNRCLKRGKPSSPRKVKCTVYYTTVPGRWLSDDQLDLVRSLASITRAKLEGHVYWGPVGEVARQAYIERVDNLFRYLGE